MSSKPSHIPLFPDAYLRDNYRFTLEQHGLNLLLLMEAWKTNDCSLPDDERALADIAQIKVAKFRAISGPVLANWTRDSGRIYQNASAKNGNMFRIAGRNEPTQPVSVGMQMQCKWNPNAMQMECTLVEVKVEVSLPRMRLLIT